MDPPRLASFDLDAWELDDGEAMHREAPDTFWIPSSSDRHSLRRDDLVKLVFRILLTDEEGQDSVEVERMWVIVKGQRAGLYEGVLDNDPYCTDEIRSGMVVFFQPRHVINIDRAERPDS